eukprot:7580098-Karenia_brevis.AAC.1
MPPGTKVLAHSLAARPELNGESGIVVSHLGGPNSERIPIKFDGVPEAVRVKRTNLVVAPSGTEVVAFDGPSL